MNKLNLVTLVCNKMDLIDEKLEKERDFLSEFDVLKKKIQLFVEEKNMNLGQVVEPVFICAKDHEVVKNTVLQMAKKLN